MLYKCRTNSKTLATQNKYRICPKYGTIRFCFSYAAMRLNDSDSMTNSVDSNHTGPLGAVWCGSAVCADLCVKIFRFFYGLLFIITLFWPYVGKVYYIVDLLICRRFSGILTKHLKEAKNKLLVWPLSQNLWDPTSPSVTKQNSALIWFTYASNNSCIFAESWGFSFNSGIELRVTNHSGINANVEQ